MEITEGRWLQGVAEAEEIVEKAKVSGRTYSRVLSVSHHHLNQPLESHLEHGEAPVTELVKFYSLQVLVRDFDPEVQDPLWKRLEAQYEQSWRVYKAVADAYREDTLEAKVDPWTAKNYKETKRGALHNIETNMKFRFVEICAESYGTTLSDLSYMIDERNSKKREVTS